MLEKIVHKMKFLNEAQVFTNATVPIDTYVLHHGMSEQLSALTVRNLRKILKSNYQVEIDLIDSIEKVNQCITQTSDAVVNSILSEEKYLTKSIIKIDVIKQKETVEEEGDEIKSVDEPKAS